MSRDRDIFAQRGRNRTRRGLVVNRGAFVTGEGRERERWDKDIDSSYLCTKVRSMDWCWQHGPAGRYHERMRSEPPHFEANQAPH